MFIGGGGASSGEMTGGLDPYVMAKGASDIKEKMRDI
jgi:hypothetical protein